uniref:Uncharacterized mitochondrial protein AtMg00810-like n=1 Tax=Tanacetum cinerariifolium TaxID=118510 RepID=A0A6L2KIQ0_TANCI|nr:uncharacterized mitochondrial protein AtMg00810-like [Tanacetum cinerariifolium]
MCVNHQDLKIYTFLIEYTRLKRHCMDYIKLLKLVYVDDIIFGSTKKEPYNLFEKLMHEKFQMSSMGELTFFLGLQVNQNKDGTFISQDKYVAKILKKFGFTEVKTTSTPMETQKPLLKDEDCKEVDVHMYRSMISSLMYLTSSRTDIMFAVCACARYQVNLKVSHLYVVKRIFMYLKGQPKLGLWYSKDSPFDLVAYTNSDYAGASLDRKSITGGCQFFGYRLISWQCKKQTMVANSTIEAEYLHAQVDGKEIVITESSVRRDLQLANEEGGTLQSDGDRLELNELMALCSNLQNRVLDLKKTKTTQRNEINSLKRRVKKLEKRNMSRTHKLKRLYKVGLSARVESSNNEESLGEDASKQERRIDAINADEDITLVSVQDDTDKEIFDVDNLGGDEVFVAGQNETVVEEVVDVAQVSIASTTITITTEEISLAQALKALKTSKPKVKGIFFKSQMFNKAFKRVNTFEDFRTDLVEGKEKRAKIELEQEITKKQKVDHHKEKAELKQLMETILDEEEVAIDAIPLAVKSPRIVDWKILKEGKKSYYQIVRADGKSQMYMIFSQMLKSFNGEDLEDLYKLKMKYGSCRRDIKCWNGRCMTPVEYIP